jgi:16S rRNA (cytosine1402-N4)-methyltransferase
VNESAYHIPVLLREAWEFLAVREGGVYVDATLGGGGYAETILERMNDCAVYGFDTDPHAIAFAGKRLARFGERLRIVPENFSMLKHALHERGVNTIDGIVYDLGVSSHQLDTPSIGLSYRVEAPLDMRLDPQLPISAQDVIDTYSEDELKSIFRRYGEESYAGPIARKIVRARNERRITTTTGLAEAIIRGMRADKQNETLSRIFQAIRIEVNRELEHLSASLEQAIEMLVPGGTMVVVSYHSLEDRIVKNLFKRESAPETATGSLEGLKERIDWKRAHLRLLTKKPVRPSAEEILRNPRARSAKLRAAEKI